MKVSTVKRYLNEFENAVRDDEMHRSFLPDIRDKVHEDYKRAKRRLHRAIEQVALTVIP